MRFLPSLALHGLGPLFLCLALGASAQQAAVPAKIKISAENRNFEWFFLIADAASEQGIWRKHGLDPDLVPAAGSYAQLKEQVAAGIKFGWVNTAEALLARSQGAPVKIVAAHFGETIAKIYSRPESPMQASRDLDGKKIGVLAATHTSYKAVMYLNEKLGIKAEPVVLGNLGNNVAALKAGRIDALYSAEGAALGYVETGELRTLSRLADVYPRPYATVVVWATDDYVREHPQLVRGFVKATLESVDYLNKHPAAASAMYQKQTKSTRGVADRAVAELNALLTSAGRGSGNDLAASVAGNWKFTKESGAAPAEASIAIDEVVDARFVQ
jgi:ABC-type nitrate/sulfonate/bicarbonate transport system substrate-binding protein